MKILIKVVAWILGALLILLIGVALFIGPLIKTGIETIGPRVTGVNITLRQVAVNLFSGNVKIKGFIIKNPEGFRTDSLMELGQFVLDLDMASLLTDTVVIKQIHIDEPAITYERGLKASNIGTLKDNLTPAKDASKEPKADAPSSEKRVPAKKVVIEDFLFENGKINVSVKLAAGKKLTLPLAPIHLEGIGKESEGASIPDVVNEVLGAILQSASQAVSASGDLAGDALKGAENLIKDPGAALQNVGGTTKEATDGLKKLGGSLLGK